MLRDEDKPRDRRQIDRLVCAELPDRETDEELFTLVTSKMVHGPCGTLNPKAPCMVDGKFFCTYYSTQKFAMYR